MSAASAASFATVLFFIFFSGFNSCPSTSLYLSDCQLCGFSFGLCGGTVADAGATLAGCDILVSPFPAASSTAQYNVELSVDADATFGFGFRTRLPACYLTTGDIAAGYVKAITVRNQDKGFDLCAKSPLTVFQLKAIASTATPTTCAQIALLPA